MVPVFHVPWLPFGWDGLAARWFILLRPNHDGLIPHEEKHIEQQKHYGIVRYLWKYWLDSKFRYKMEYEAYLVHLPPDKAHERAMEYL